MRNKTNKNDSTIVPIFSAKFQGLVCLSVSAKDLSTALGLSDNFLLWIHSKIVKNRLIEGVDYLPVYLRLTVGKIFEDIYLPLSTAKLLCIQERNHVSYPLRKSFFKSERDVAKYIARSTQRQQRLITTSIELQRRCYYWALYKIELLVSNGVRFPPGQIISSAESISDSLLKEFQQHFQKHYDLPDTKENRQRYIKDWIPAFAKSLPALHS